MNYGKKTTKDVSCDENKFEPVDDIEECIRDQFSFQEVTSSGHDDIEVSVNSSLKELNKSSGYHCFVLNICVYFRNMSDISNVIPTKLIDTRIPCVSDIYLHVQKFGFYRHCNSNILALAYT